MPVTQTMDLTTEVESLEKVIYNVGRSKTPFVSMLKKRKIDATNPKWFEDKYEPGDPDNKTVEGAVIVPASGDQPDKIGTYTQIMKESISVSTTADAVKKIGSKKETTRQMVKKGVQIKLDMEARFLSNKASVKGLSATPSETAGVAAWIKTNSNRGAGGADGGYQSGSGLITAATNGTQRLISEDLFKAMVIDVAGNSKDSVGVVMLGKKNKQRFSGFAGLAANRINNKSSAKSLAIVATADVYVSDFGTHHIVWNNNTPERTCLALNMASWSLGTLVPFAEKDLAKVGLSTDKFVSTEVALICHNEEANGVLADLTE